MDELHRISLPGAVVPSLFWALPVGRWRQEELDSLWNFFTRPGSSCFDFGLLLVEDMASAGAMHPSNLQQVGAALDELLPKGTERHFDIRQAQAASRQIFILSGAYPQPGWGVLVQISQDQGALRVVSRLVDMAIDSLGSDDATETAKRVIREASSRYHEWKDLNESRPDLPIDPGLLEDSRAAEAIKSALMKIEAAVAGRRLEALPAPLMELISTIEKCHWLELSEATNRLRRHREDAMVSAAVLAPTDEQFAMDVEPRLATIARDPLQKGSILRECTDKVISRAIRNALELSARSSLQHERSLRARATALQDSARTGLSAELGPIASLVDAKLSVGKAAVAARQAEIDRAKQHWAAQMSSARQIYHRSIAQAADVQWQFGPRLLMAFETAAAKLGLTPLAIPWDPPRMIGWKLQISHGGITLHDLRQATTELGFEVTSLSAMNGGGTEAKVDGSYFTDYVHYVAISGAGESPRVVTRKLLARLLRPTELRRLLGSDLGREAADSDRESVADAVLAHMGWKEDVAQRRIPLAEWAQRLKRNPDAAVQPGTAVEIRIALENLCKDVLDIISYRLGYGEEQVWAAIHERIPDYQPFSHRRIWLEEVEALTPGSAVLLIGALAPIAFPGNEPSISAWVASIKRLGISVRAPTHDRETESGHLLSRQVAEQVDSFLTHSHGVLGELPWHLSPSFVYGEQPKVICGEAWSHSQAVPRMLRVIASHGVAPRQEIVLWNQSGTNPVITDPVFLTRGLRANED